MCHISQCRLIIFISDFALDILVPIEQVLCLLQQILQFVESRGHLITFAFLLYVPAYSRDPRTKPSFTPVPDHTNYLIKLNDQIKIFALRNPLKICFNHKRIGYNAKNDRYKGKDWHSYSSTVDFHLSFQFCFSYTQDALRQRSIDFYPHVNNFVNSVT